MFLKRRNEPRDRIQVWLDRTATIGVCVAIAALAWARLAPAREREIATEESAESLISLPDGPVSLAGAEVEGDPRAPAVILACVDFQAALSAIFAIQTLPAIENVYIRAGRVRFAVKPFPVRVHAYAFAAARNAACAARQGKFWRAHDYLFHNQPSLPNTDPRQWPQSLGLDRDALTACLADPAVDAEIRASIRSGEDLGLSMVPTYFIGRPAAGEAIAVTDVLAGPVTFGQFKTALDKLLKE